MALKGMDSIELEENIYPIDAIDQELARNLTIDKLFDVYRFVDMRTHLVHDYNDGKMCEPCRKCYELWNRSKPCPNCSSERAVQQKKQIMKMEYLGDKSILILSTPWEQDGKEYVLELGRDVTNSFSVYDATSEDSSELRELISSYSELAARDSFTRAGMHPRDAPRYVSGLLLCPRRGLRGHQDGHLRPVPAGTGGQKAHPSLLRGPQRHRHLL